MTGGGLLSFNNPPQFAAPMDANADNVYEVAVQVSDGTFNAQQTILVTVTAVAAYPLPGDFNDDGVVDAADLPVWRSHFGQTTGANDTEGDADGDHDVDGADFLIWQRSLGQTLAPAAAAVVAGADPEASVQSNSADTTLGKNVVLSDRLASLRPTSDSKTTREARPTRSTGAAPRLPYRPAPLVDASPSNAATAAAPREIPATPEEPSDAVFADETSLVQILARLAWD
jgi:hypothetical protein